MASAGMDVNSRALSTSILIVLTPERTTNVRARASAGMAGNPKRVRRLMLGMMFPGVSVMPSTKGATFGAAVTFPGDSTDCTFLLRTPQVLPATSNRTKGSA